MPGSSSSSSSRRRTKSESCTTSLAASSTAPTESRSVSNLPSAALPMRPHAWSPYCSPRASTTSGPPSTVTQISNMESLRLAPHMASSIVPSLPQDLTRVLKDGLRGEVERACIFNLGWVRVGVFHSLHTIAAAALYHSISLHRCSIPPWLRFVHLSEKEGTQLTSFRTYWSKDSGSSCVSSKAREQELIFHCLCTFLSFTYWFTHPPNHGHLS